jgi:hypothetical protein
MPKPASASICRRKPAVSRAPSLPDSAAKTENAQEPVR